MQVLRAADGVATPWKNGGGVTREIAAWPPGSGFDDFHWRISMAEVRVDGPFSLFPGVDRILAVLRGRLALDIAGRPPIEMQATSIPAAFPGDVATAGRVLDGPVVDLNVMTRRGAVRGALTRLDIWPRAELEASRHARLLLALGPTRVGGSSPVDLEPHDAVLFAPGDPATVLEAHAGAAAYLAVLEAA